MYSTTLLDEWLRYTEWADATVWSAVLSHDAARRDETLRDYLLHLHNVQRAFLLAWKGQPPDSAWRRASDFASLVELHAWTLPYYAEARQFVSGADAATLGSQVVMPWVTAFEQQLGKTFAAPTVAETVYQVVSHSTYHRGQVNARLRAVGGEPPLVDYIAWVWFGKPDAMAAAT